MSLRQTVSYCKNEREGLDWLGGRDSHPIQWLGQLGKLAFYH